MNEDQVGGGGDGGKREGKRVEGKEGKNEI